MNEFKPLEKWKKDDANILWMKCDFCHNFRKQVRITDGVTTDDFRQIKREILTKHVQVRYQCAN